MKYARFVNNVAVEFFNTPDGFTIDQCFHPDVVKQFEAVGDDFELGQEKVVDPVENATLVEEVVDVIADTTETPVVDETVTPAV